jgi:GNAT superfamily N-acetyltransferase
MIICNHELFIEQLKLIDLKSYEDYWCDNKWESVLEDNAFHFRMFNIDETIAGFYCYRSEGKIVLLDRLCVRPSIRCQGIGSALMDDFLETFKGAKKRCLLREDNHFVTWIAAWGWKAVGLKPMIFGDVDGITMEHK